MRTRGSWLEVETIAHQNHQCNEAKLLPGAFALRFFVEEHKLAKVVTREVSVGRDHATVLAPGLLVTSTAGRRRSWPSS